MSSSFEFPELVVPPAPAVRESRRDEERARAEAEAAAEARLRAEVEAARAEGYAAGLAEGRAEVEPAVAALRAAAEELRAERERAAERAEAAAAELSLLIAEKVIGAALELRPELVLEVVRGALRRVAEPRESVLLVNPEDLELVAGAVEALSVEFGAPLSARAERRVSRGGCVLRSQAGEIDARVEEQLRRAREIVEAELGG